MLKILQINALDLFIYLDFPLTKSVSELSESEWQEQTYSNKKNKPLKRISGLVEMIQREDPDVILLNEVGGQESLINFNKLFLESSYNVAMAKGTSTRGIDNGFLVKPKFTFEIKGIDKEKVDGEKVKFNRSVNYLSLFYKKSKILNIFGVHLKSQRGNSNDYESIITRYNEVKALVQILKPYEDQDVPYVLTGDFNGRAAGHEQDMEFDQLYDSLSLKDIHQLKETPEEKKFSYIYFNGLTPNFSQIDYLMLSKELHNKLISASNSYYLYNGEYTYSTKIELKEKLASDHYPQIAVLDIKVDDE